MTPLYGVFNSLRALRAADQRRAGVPGEHWATFGAALTALGAARSIRSPWLRTATFVVGGVLVLRAISGRDGALALAKRKARSQGLLERSY
jgi:hypothetical protein